MGALRGHLCDSTAFLLNLIDTAADLDIRLSAALLYISVEPWLRQYTVCAPLANTGDGSCRENVDIVICENMSLADRDTLASDHWSPPATSDRSCDSLGN